MTIPPIPENILSLFRLIAFSAGAYIFVFWVGLLVWTFQDIRRRSRDILAQILAVLLVALFNLPGLLIYYVMRPQDLLADSYERSLEEEALLQSIEERLLCPGCRQRVQPDYILCPSCHSKLKKRCPHCDRLLHLKWDACPYCGRGVKE